MKKGVGKDVLQERFLSACSDHRSGRFKEAEVSYRAVLRLRPGHKEALSNLGVVLRQTGRLTEARQVLEKVTQIDSTYPPAWSNLTNVYLDLGLKSKAVDAGRLAVENGQGHAKPLGNLGWALWCNDEFDESRKYLEASLKIDAHAANVWNNLGNVHQRQCRIDEAIACFQRALDLDPKLTIAMQNIAFCMHFSDRYSAEEIASFHRQWAATFEYKPLEKLSRYHHQDVQRDGKLRVAFMSPDLKDHPVSAFFRALVENWPRGSFELWFVSNVKAPDTLTNWYRSQANGWIDSVGMTDAETARRISDSRIDILIDLCGHTAGNRLLVMPYRPAPVQATWLGYFDTTGMASVDYLIGDTTCIQPGDDERFSERVVRLPVDFLCYSPPPAPAVNQLPALTNGYFTFGSQNQLVKVTPKVIEVWSRILRDVPDSRLVLAGRALNDSSTRTSFIEAFLREGIETHRLDLRPGTSQQGILRNYQDIDLALDPFPCAGGTTTCEALYMGVPVVSLFGDRFAGRHSAAHLMACGLDEFVTYDTDSYHALSVKIGCSPQMLSSLRANLRPKMQASQLCDGAGFARNFSEVLQYMWMQHAHSKPRALGSQRA